MFITWLLPLNGLLGSSGRVTISRLVTTVNVPPRRHHYGSSTLDSMRQTLRSDEHVCCTTDAPAPWLSLRKTPGVEAIAPLGHSGAAPSDALVTPGCQRHSLSHTRYKRASHSLAY